MPRILKLTGKCSDCCWAELDGQTRMGYVPRGLGVGGGDNIKLEIDIDTGQIMNWKVPSQESIDSAFSK